MDKNNPKRELDWLFFDRKNGKFVATDTRMIVIITPQNTSASEFYDYAFPHLKSADGLEYINNKGIAFKSEGKYPDYERIIPKGDHTNRVYSLSMWRTTMQQNIILDVFRFPNMVKALKIIDILGEGTVIYNNTENGNNMPVMFEIDKEIRYGTDHGDYFSALIQVIVMPVVV